MVSKSAMNGKVKKSNRIGETRSDRIFDAVNIALMLLLLIIFIFILIIG